MASDSHKHEARHARLQTLADSINDTARMARGTLSLVLLVALYLGLTLLSSTDENILRNSQVVLPPPLGTGASLVQSYVFAPLVFFYLHGQALLLLIVLARKVQTFEAALRNEFPDTTTQDSGQEFEAIKREYRDWLSAFTFVQIFRQDPGAWTVSRIFIWFGTDAIPLFLLFVIDISFVRYQSVVVTWFHHTVFVVDLLFLVYFNWKVFGGSFRVVSRGSVAKQWGRLRIFANAAVTLVKGVVAFGMALLLLLAAQPPSETEKKTSIWHDDNGSEVWGGWEAVWDGENLLDVGPCWWWNWRQTCRYLDLSNKWFVTIKSDEPDKADDGSRRKCRSELQLAGRNLRFAKFRLARLPCVELRNAQLQHANFREAWVQDAYLSGADLTDAWLESAHFERADLKESVLVRARLFGAELAGADLRGADLREVDSRFISLFGFGSVNLQDVKLDNADLRKAYLWGADLRKADLSRAKLHEAEIRMADLEEANLREANLRNVDLRGLPAFFSPLFSLFDRTPDPSTNLQDVTLQGADLQEADLRQTKGIDCPQLKSAENWEKAYRPEELACEESIPAPQKNSTPKSSASTLTD